MSYINKDATLAAIANKAKAELADVNHYFLEGVQLAVDVVEGMPEVQPSSSCVHENDTISRRAAIDATWFEPSYTDPLNVLTEVRDRLKALPSAQPDRRCVNCGRTVNNGGWYEDGRTRCPIEEHYALPKDGYCHLWEKKKVWEDDYVKRPEEGEK